MIAKMIQKTKNFIGSYKTKSAKKKADLIASYFVENFNIGLQPRVHGLPREEVKKEKDLIKEHEKDLDSPVYRNMRSDLGPLKFVHYADGLLGALNVDGKVINRWRSQTEVNRILSEVGDIEVENKPSKKGIVNYGRQADLCAFTEIKVDEVS